MNMGFLQTPKNIPHIPHLTYGITKRNAKANSKSLRFAANDSKWYNLTFSTHTHTHITMRILFIVYGIAVVSFKTWHITF